MSFAARFAPSPTGLLHLGNARTALFNFLAARAHGGELLLRIEDTDSGRAVAGFADALAEDLRWLGLDWRATAPQSQRKPAHETLLRKLAAAGAAYPCFCAPEELAAERARLLAAGKPPRYSGKCAALSEAAAKKKIAAGEKPATRFRMPRGVVALRDLVRGEMRFEGGDIGDFIVRRASGEFSFFFVNAADDAADGVTHVLRGEDHLSNAPRQIALLAALGLRRPLYGHLPLLTDANGKPLSKRGGALSLAQMRRDGYLPSAVLNYLARLGCAFSRGEAMTAEEMAAEFSFARLSKSPAKFDEKQLLSRQREALHSLDGGGRLRWMDGLTPPGANPSAFADAVIGNVSLFADVKEWARTVADASPNADAAAVIKKAGGDFYRSALAAMENGNGDRNDGGGDGDWRAFCDAAGARTKLRGKDLFLPLRAALTGQTSGPEMSPFFALISEDERKKRLRAAIALADSN